MERGTVSGPTQGIEHVQMQLSTEIVQHNSMNIITSALSCIMWSTVGLPVN